MMRRIFQLAIRFFSDKSFARGVTLVELLAVLAIIIVITAIIVPNYRAGGQQLALDRSAYRLAQDIRRIQEMAMSSREGDCGVDFKGSYGIKLENNSDHYILFADCDNQKEYTPGEEIGESIKFESGVSFRRSQYLSGLNWVPQMEAAGIDYINILFSPPYPERTISSDDSDMDDAPYQRLVLLTTDNKNKCVFINVDGLIYVDDCED